MNPLIPLSYLKKAIESVPDFDTCKTHFFRHVFSISPKVEFEWEKSDILKEWVLVKVIMQTEEEYIESRKEFELEWLDFSQGLLRNANEDEIVTWINGPNSQKDSESPLILTGKLPYSPPLYYTGQTDPETKP